jgi:hypothetical protein
VNTPCEKTESTDFEEDHRPVVFFFAKNKAQPLTQGFLKGSHLQGSGFLKSGLGAVAGRFESCKNSAAARPVYERTFYDPWVSYRSAFPGNQRRM